MVPFSFMPSTILVTLGEPLRLVLDNFVKGLPLQNTARELIGDFTTFSSSLPVSFKERCVSVNCFLCFEYVNHVNWTFEEHGWTWLHLLFSGLLVLIWIFTSFIFNIENLLIEFTGSCRHITKRNTFVETKDV